jgi:hypothetical protein
MITRTIYVNLIRSPRRETGAAGNPNSGTDRVRLADFVKGDPPTPRTRSTTYNAR